MTETQRIQAARELALDFRTTEEIDQDHDALLEDLRETLTGLPARPGVRR